MFFKTRIECIYHLWDSFCLTNIQKLTNFSTLNENVKMVDIFDIFSIFVFKKYLPGTCIDNFLIEEGYQETNI